MAVNVGTGVTVSRDKPRNLKEVSVAVGCNVRMGKIRIKRGKETLGCEPKREKRRLGLCKASRLVHGEISTWKVELARYCCWNDAAVLLYTYPVQNATCVAISQR